MRCAERLLLIALLAAPACAPTETGNPPSAQTIDFLTLSSDPAAVGSEPGAAKITVSSLWHGIQRVGYMPCGGGVGDVVYFSEAPAAIDWLAGKARLAGDVVPPGSYCALLLSDATVPNAAGAPEALATYSFFATGHLAAQTPFEVRGDNFGLERKFAAGALELGADSPPLLLELDLAKLFLPLALDGRGADSDGVIRVDVSQATGDPGGFRATWQSAVEAHQDLNRNGRVDPDEPSL